MTKIDPTPLIAEAQARETALKVAERRIEALDRALNHTAIAGIVMFWIGLLLGIAAGWVLP